MDPGILAGEVGGGGGGGGSRSNCQITALTFSCVFFQSLTFFTVLQRVSNGYLKENYNFPGFQRGPTFSRGGGGGGPNASFYRNRLSPL